MKKSSRSMSRFMTLRGGALAVAMMLLFTSVIVQPVQAQGITKTVVCGSLSLFASASTATLDFQVAAMNAAFQLQINLLQTSWELEDQATSLIRSVSEQSFMGLLSLYSAVTSHTPAEKAAVNVYKDTMLNALNVLRNKIDAIRAAYREDMMALVKAHQKALASLVTQAVGQIKSALQTAVTDCGKRGAVTKLLSVIASATFDLAANGLALEVSNLAKALKLVLTRNAGFHKADGEFLKTAVSATGQLKRATIGFRAN